MRRFILDCYHTDTCLPDYFSGDARPWLTVPVSNRDTFADLRRYLIAEIIQGAIGGNDDRTCDNHPDAQAFTRAMIAAVNRLQPAKKGARRPFPNLEDQDPDSDYQVQAFFVFVERNT